MNSFLSHLATHQVIGFGRPGARNFVPPRPHNQREFEWLGLRHPKPAALPALHRKQRSNLYSRYSGEVFGR